MSKKKPSKEPDRHRNQLVGLRLAPDVMAALKAHAEAEERSVAWMAAKLLKEIMAQKGILPPQQGT